MLADTKLPVKYWEEANRYATFLYNHLPPHGKDINGEARKSPQELFFNMGPSLILHHIRPFGVWCYSHIAAQIRKRKDGKSHNEWGSRVRFMGFEDYTLVGMRLYCPISDEIIVNSATFPSGPDLMSLQIPTEALERIGVISSKKS